MEKRSGLARNPMYWLIRRELAQLYGKSEADRVLALATEIYATCAQLCLDATKGEWTHLNNTILPTVSIYKALLETDPEHALTSAHVVMMGVCKIGGVFLRTLLRLPGMKVVFMRLLPKLAVRMFDPGCGFQFENYEASKNLLKMDMTSCPYCRFARRLGVPELIFVFCESDFATYGNLPGIRFERTGTLGTGADRCDFRFILK